MITESRVQAALPKEGFMPSYVRYAVTRTDAPAAFHLGVGLAILSRIAPPDLGIPWFPKVLRANFWTLLIGRSGDRKTSAIDAGADVLREAAPDVDVSEAPGSPEALGAMMKERAQRLIVYREFGEFLSQTTRGYAKPIREKYTQLYDCTDRVSTIFKSKTVTIEDPRVSLLAGGTPAHLEQFTAPGDWEGGFCARFCSIFADRERTHTDPDPTIDWDASLAKIAAHLRPLCNVSGIEIGTCKTPFDDASLKRWREWYKDVDSRGSRVPERIRGSLQRMPMVALKAAMLYAFDIGLARGGRDKTWAITPQVLEPAIALAEIHYDSLQGISDRIAESDDMRDRQTVLRTVVEGAHELGDIVSKARLLPKRVNEILDGLVVERVLGKRRAEDESAEWYVRPKLAPTAAAPKKPGSAADAGKILPLDGDVPVLGDDSPQVQAALDQIPGEKVDRPMLAVVSNDATDLDATGTDDGETL